MPAEPEHERRSEARITPLQTLYGDYPEQRPYVRDIGLSGAYLVDSNPLFRGRIFQLRLWLDKRAPITVKVMVRRYDQAKGMSVEFLTMSEEDRRRLRAFLGAPAGAGRLPSL